MIKNIINNITKELNNRENRQEDLLVTCVRDKLNTSLDVYVKEITRTYNVILSHNTKIFMDRDKKDNCVEEIENDE